MLLSHVFYTFLTRLSVAVMNIVIVLLTTKLLGVSGRGELVFFITNIQLVMLFANLIGGSSIINVIHHVSFSKLLVYSYGWTMITAFIGSLFLVFTEQIAFSVVILFFLTTLFSGLITHHWVMFIALNKMNWFNGFTFLQIFLVLMSIVTCIVFDYALTPIYCFQILLFSSCLTWLLSFLTLWNYKKNMPYISQSMSLFEFVKIGILAELGSLIFFVMNRLNYYIIMNGIGSALELGFYSTVLTIAETVLMLAHSIASVKMARLMRFPMALKKNKIYSFKLLQASIVLCVLASLFLVLIPSSFFVWLFHDQIFYNMKPLFITLALGAMAYAIAIVIKAYFNTIAQYQYEIKAASMAMSVNIILSFVFVHFFYLQGLAMAYAVGYAFFLALMLYYYHKHTNTLNKSLISFRLFSSYWRLIKNK